MEGRTLVKMESVYNAVMELHALIGNCISDAKKSDAANLSAGKRLRKNMNKAVELAMEVKRLVIVKRPGDSKEEND